MNKDDCKNAYIKLGDELGRKPKLSEYFVRTKTSKRQLEKVFGNNAYSKLQSECGDPPNKLILERTPLEKIYTQWGNLTRELKAFPTQAD